MTTSGQVGGAPQRVSAPLAPVARAQARAYCGPGHGVCWTPEGDGSPAAVVELPAGERAVRYRLVRQVRTGRPVRGYLGNFLYVPVQHDRDFDP